MMKKLLAIFMVAAAITASAPGQSDTPAPKKKNVPTTKAKAKPKAKPKAKAAAKAKPKAKKPPKK